MAGPARYELVRKIADGGMAAIYLGIQRGAASFERPVVIKAIRPDRLTDTAFRNALIDEAQIGMALNHSNIVQVLDLGESGGRYFLIMELVDGWDLDQVLRRSATAGFEIPVPLALHITAEVCRALGYAHGKTRRGKPLHIIHRDVSPHNVLLSEHGEVKLTDFGIATAEERLERTKTGLIKGKVGFMSPEQASGEPLGPPSDLFSLGSILYLMVTGVRPFTAPTELETLLRTQEARFTPVRELRPDLSPEVGELIHRAMHKSPRARFETAEQMLEAVEKVERGLQPAGATELRRWLGDLSSRDHDMPVTKLTSPPLEVGDDDIVTSSGLVLNEIRPADISVAMPAAPPRRSRAVGVAFAALVAGMGCVAYWFWRSTAAEVVAERQPPPPSMNPAGSPPSPAAPARAPLDPAVAPPTAPGPVAAATSAIDAGAALDAGAIAGVTSGTDAGPPLAVATAKPPPPPVEPPVAEPKPGHSRSVGAEKGEDGEDPVVSIGVSSVPAGAQVFVENRGFGPTPLKIRVRSGLSYEVSFAYPGYQTLKQHLFVSKRKNQTLSVLLRKQ